MLRHLMNRLLGSLTGHKHHGNHGHYGQHSKYGYPHHSHSSSDYKKGSYYPPQQPKYGHGIYKKKHGSYSS
ncbi:hypothetical protein DFQ01_11696 [Paenibacillus cellulosilyticus]|uniref:Uncharacterized protein n=1 Tax=Paenibacillus cellulosilyticus TaxID=375489 RepID=A0A2V2YQF5_9BACL|nr:hypothetical protein [Paenibacillus cellulosilyticus]PWV98697.1 hypothetical protein DFQ01_11696 [Paenibacillus cellulosilyticus]QKS43802.1 hypothetical protein HUB94_04640 [Paenibacillus cellulosilyticus]